MITESIFPAVRIVWSDVPRAILGTGSGPRPTISFADPDGARESDGVGLSVVLDFGVEVYGGVRFDVVAVDGGGPGWLHVRLGESVSEAMVGNYLDREVEVQPGAQLDLGVTGFRFARIDLIGESGGVRIAVPEAYNLAHDTPRLGSFRSSDPRIDRIWEVGARTTHLCMQAHIWDGIKRGRTVWAGDLHPTANVIAAVFGPHPIVGASMDHLRDRTASRHGPEWMNDIPGYSLWWIITQAEWYRYTGDLTYLQAQHAYLTGLLSVISEDIDATGRESFQGWRYLDWATPRDAAAIHAGYQGLTAWALRSAQAIALALGDLDLHDRSGQVLARVESYRPPTTASKAAHALLVLGGLADPEATNRTILAPTPGIGLTPFLGSSVLEARALAGDHAGALDLIRTYWGAMIDLGATTFWEDFDLDWVAGSGRIDEVVPAEQRDIHAGLGRNVQRGMGLSLCHAWSAGPTAWLSRHVLGVRPIGPGCRSVWIEPHLGNLTRAEGTFPTPLGLIHVRHQRQADGTIATEFEAPESIKIVAG